MTNIHSYIHTYIHTYIHIHTYIQHLTFNHPPNKWDFVRRGGIPHGTKALRNFPGDVSVTHQGLALMVNILANDSQAKMDISSTRQMALAHGIVDIVQTAESNFVSSDTSGSGSGSSKTSESLQDMCKVISEMLLSEIS
jgi:hypothetical protein